MKTASTSPAYDSPMLRLYLALTLVLVRSLPSQIVPSRPPDPYVADGACPFECCTYRVWWPNRPVQLVDRPGSTHIVATVRKGEHVKALTGEVILHPVRYTLTGAANVEPAFDRWHSQALPRDVEIPAGSTVWLLDNLGEGYVSVWWEGGVYSYGIADDAPFRTEATRLLKQADSPSVWWVRIRTRSGRIGWTAETAAFENTDACD
jgi:hypothetical protein